MYDLGLLVSPFFCVVKARLRQDGILGIASGYNGQKLQIPPLFFLCSVKRTDLSGYRLDHLHVESWRDLVQHGLVLQNIFGLNVALNISYTPFVALEVARSSCCCNGSRTGAIKMQI